MGLGAAFWTGLHIRGESELIACHCVRLLRIRDFVDEFVSGRLFSSAIPEVN